MPDCRTSTASCLSHCPNTYDYDSTTMDVSSVVVADRLVNLSTPVGRSLCWELTVPSTRYYPPPRCAHAHINLVHVCAIVAVLDFQCCNGQ